MIKIKYANFVILIVRQENVFMAMIKTLAWNAHQIKSFYKIFNALINENANLVNLKTIINFVAARN